MWVCMSEVNNEVCAVYKDTVVVSFLPSELSCSVSGEGKTALSGPLWPLCDRLAPS